VDKDKLAYTMPETAAKLGISKSLAYKLASEGILPVVALGTKRLVPRAKLERLINEGIPVSGTHNDKSGGNPEPEGSGRP
jgi:excisionase family DNA binding protein